MILDYGTIEIKDKNNKNITKRKSVVVEKLSQHSDKGLSPEIQKELKEQFEIQEKLNLTLFGMIKELQGVVDELITFRPANAATTTKMYKFQKTIEKIEEIEELIN